MVSVAWVLKEKKLGAQRIL